jgi:hypothetical protein
VIGALPKLPSQIAARSPPEKTNRRKLPMASGPGGRFHHVELQARPLAIDQWIDMMRYESPQIELTV